MTQAQKAVEAYAKELEESVEALLADTARFNNIVDRTRRIAKLREALG